MNAENNKKLDELILGAISRDKPKFDFDKWKAKHKKEIQIYESQTAEQKVSRSVWIFETGKIIARRLNSMQRPPGWPRPWTCGIVW